MERFECKASLKLNIPEQDNVMGLSWGKYEVTSCSYKFYQDITPEGEVRSGLRGGIIELSIEGKPGNDLMNWMFDHTKKYNGEITIGDTHEEVLEQLYFEQARCVDLAIEYQTGSNPPTVTVIKIVAAEMRIGNAYFETINQ